MSFKACWGVVTTMVDVHDKESCQSSVAKIHGWPDVQFVYMLCGVKKGAEALFYEGNWRRKVKFYSNLENVKRLTRHALPDAWKLETLSKN